MSILPSRKHSVAVEPEETPGLSSFLRGHWDEGLLIAVLLALALMLGYILWPPPRAVLTLHPLTASELVALSNGSASSLTEKPPLTQTAESTAEGSSTLETSDGESGNAPAKKPSHRRTHGFHHAKKPKHPPILNLNQASLSQLQLLPGIGPKTAERIVDYRRTHGRFAEPAQIMDVKGIGPKKFEKLKPYLKV